MSSEILEKLKWRYACKKFDTTKKLTQEKLTILKNAFNLTATSYGLQPLKMLVISNQTLKEALVPLTMNQSQVADCSEVLVLCTETKISSNYIKEYFERVKTIRKVKDSIIDPFRSHIINSFDKKSSDDIELWSTKQAYLAMGNLLAVCADLKIDACPMEGFSPDKYDKFFNLKSKNLKSVLIMPMGYRSKDDIFSTMQKVRKSLNLSVVDII